VGHRLRVDQGSQARSRAVFERVVSAAEDALDGRDWDTLTVEDICLAADVSPSSFYRRFSTKDALLDEVHERWLRSRRDAAMRIANGSFWSELTQDEVFNAICRAYLADRANSSARSLSMFRVQVSNPRLAAARQRTDREILTAVAKPLAAFVDRDETDVAFALLTLSAAVLAAVQPPSPFIEILGWTEDQLAERYVVVFRRMLNL